MRSTESRSEAEPRATGAGPDIVVASGSGAGRTLLSAFDAALLDAGIANFNLIRLSSVIPAGSTIRREGGVVGGRFGDALYCVYSAAYADHPGETAWAGVGWVVDATGAGLFVEHHGGSRRTVEEQIRLSLEDMSANRGGGFGETQIVTSSIHCDNRPVCAVVIAAYEVGPWGRR